MNQAYPSIEELLPTTIKTRIPMDLGKAIEQRYLSLGDKYQTMYQHTDGRLINGMMFTSRIENCEEEVVDAVFCMLGHIFRCSEEGIEPSQNIYACLDGLVQVWSLLIVEKELDVLTHSNIS